MKLEIDIHRDNDCAVETWVCTVQTDEEILDRKFYQREDSARKHAAAIVSAILLDEVV